MAVLWEQVIAFESSHLALKVSNPRCVLGWGEGEGEREGQLPVCTYCLPFLQNDNNIFYM